MIRNVDNAWLAMLIFKATDIPGINKSPSELLNARKYRTNLPMMDIHQKAKETEIERLSDKRMKPTTGKELPKIPVDTPILYKKNPNSSWVKYSNWCKGTVKDRTNPRSYQILTDDKSSDKIKMSHQRIFYMKWLTLYNLM